MTTATGLLVGERVRVVARKAGTAVITATAEAKSGTAVVNVRAPPP
jgi:hypothetical protein